MADPVWMWLLLDTEVSDEESDIDVESKGVHVDVFVSLLPLHECTLNMFNARRPQFVY